MYPSGEVGTHHKDHQDQHHNGIPEVVTHQLLELGVGEPMVQGDWDACSASKQCIESGELPQ